MEADKGRIWGIFKYAKLLQNGDGIPMDKEEAAKYFKIGADKNDVDCIFNYGIMLFKGEGVPINKNEAEQ